MHIMFIIYINQQQTNFFILYRVLIVNLLWFNVLFEIFSIKKDNFLLIACGLHRVFEEVRIQFDTIDKIVANVKKNI